MESELKIEDLATKREIVRVFTPTGVIYFLAFVFFLLILVFCGYLLYYVNHVIKNSMHLEDGGNGKSCGIPYSQLIGLSAIAIALIVLSTVVILFVIDMQFPAFFSSLMDGKKQLMVRDQIIYLFVFFLLQFWL